MSASKLHPSRGQLFNGLAFRDYICHFCIHIEDICIMNFGGSVAAGFADNLCSTEWLVMMVIRWKNPPVNRCVCAWKMPRKIHHWPKSETHCIQSARSHTTTCTHTAHHQSVHALQLQSCVEICCEECARIPFRDDNIAFLRLQARQPTLQTRFSPLLENRQDRRLTEENPRIGHVRLRVLDSCPDQWNSTFSSGVNKSFDGSRC